MLNLLFGEATPPLHTTSDVPPDYGLFIAGILVGLLAGIFINLLIKAIKNHKKNQREMKAFDEDYEKNVKNA